MHAFASTLLTDGGGVVWGAFKVVCSDVSVQQAEIKVSKYIIVKYIPSTVFPRMRGRAREHERAVRDKLKWNALIFIDVSYSLILVLFQYHLFVLLM